MPSQDHKLDADFNELIARLAAGRDLGHAGVEPVYYLVFAPRQIVDVKRMLPAWLSRLTNANWSPHCFSLAEAVTAILEQAPPRKFWIGADRKAPHDWARTNQALANALTQGALAGRLAAKLDELHNLRNALLLLTDVEALHPYLRMGVIENQLTGKFIVPTVILYPGERTGKTRLMFLGFYPEDGNYRSVHVGG